ncbi:hypothetical protein JTB14_008123 [Gonioctena quinquepunctata]|nr:hypothetical protein JTB14_008123 [Gonioctena quinquepunctata]
MAYFGTIDMWKNLRFKCYNETKLIRMEMRRPIPSYIAGVKYWITYPGQQKTCRKCNSTEHEVKDCDQVLSYRLKRNEYAAAVRNNEPRRPVNMASNEVIEENFVPLSRLPEVVNQTVMRIRANPIHIEIRRRFISEAAYIDRDIILNPDVKSRLIHERMVVQNRTESSVERKSTVQKNWELIFRNINDPILSHTQKHQIYLLIHDAFPFNKNIFKIGKSLTDLCAICNANVETLKHKFMCNDQARAITAYLLGVLEKFTKSKCNLDELLDFNSTFGNKTKDKLFFNVWQVIETPFIANIADYKQMLFNSSRILYLYDANLYRFFRSCLA